MREQFILAHGLDWAEITRCLALHGKPCIGLNIHDATTLARKALTRSGIIVAEEFIDRNGELALVSEALSSAIAAGNG